MVDFLCFYTLLFNAEYRKDFYEANPAKSSQDLKVPTHMKEGNIWKLLMISEQSVSLNFTEIHIARTFIDFVNYVQEKYLKCGNS